MFHTKNSQSYLLPVCIVLFFFALFPPLALADNNSDEGSCWVGTWASSPQLADSKDVPAKFTSTSSVTLRQVVRVSTGGERMRIRFSNAFGKTPLVLSGVRVAMSEGASTVKSDTAKDLIFGGQKSVSIPAGALMISDPLEFPLPALADVAITIYLQSAPVDVTSHPGSRTTSYMVPGNFVSATSMLQAVKVDHWYYINGIDVNSPDCGGSVVVLGDSITDGRGSTTNGNDRWPDLLSHRLQALPEMRRIGVLNHGIGGNRLLRNSLGPNALARFDRDVLAQTGVRWLIVLEGVNDIGTRLTAKDENEGWATAEDIIAAYQQIITRAHAHGIKVFGATILPFRGSSYFSPETDLDRQKINQWILTSGAFDGVVDFDKITRDPQFPDRLLPAFDIGDHLHPSPAGYAAMAEAVPLSWFAAKRTGTNGKLRMAITFDDLPAHAALPPGVTRLDVASRTIDALRKAHVPPTFGFVNGLRVQEMPGDVEVLRMWRAAGHPLANHTWSHMNLNQHSLAEFESDLVRNEPLLSQIGNDDWRWLRFPYLATGETVEKRSATRALLAARGYKIAAVTMSFGDYLWNDPYARCSAMGDSKSISALRAAYLSAADQDIDYYRTLSHQLMGRDINYVLLLHIGAFDAEMLPELLRLYESKGFEFVTLPEAQADSFYSSDNDPRLPASAETLEQALAERNIELPKQHPVVLLDFDKLCR